MIYSKIFVAEDLDSNNLGMVATLEKMGIATIEQSQFCDNALLKIKKAIIDFEPFEVLISDLCFNTAHGKKNISSGQELISEVKKIQPNIKVIVFSVEDKQSIIESLMEDQQIDAYVCKGLNGLKELKNAIEALSKNKKYSCPVATASLQQKNILELDIYEQKLLELLANGYKQSEISELFKKKLITPNSVRSIETSISKLKDSFNASTTPQLVYMASSLGLI